LQLVSFSWIKLTFATNALQDTIVGHGFGRRKAEYIILIRIIHKLTREQGSELSWHFVFSMPYTKACLDEETLAGLDRLDNGKMYPAQIGESARCGARKSESDY